MPGLYDLVSRYASPYYNIIATVFVLIIFAIAGYYSYQYYIDKQTERAKNDEIYQPADGRVARIYFFTADWCPHCKSAKPTIDDFNKKYNNKTVKGQTLTIIRVDCTDADKPDVAKLMNVYSVKSFPTIKLVKINDNGKEDIYDFEAKITDSHLEEFINSAIN
jgi:thiol-disulfide isomerase/thioredoxin